MTLNEFHLLVGKSIMFCQCIENDIKLIYAKMLMGNYIDNYKIVEKMSLGNVLMTIKELDSSDHKRWFTQTQYELLQNITAIRNYWAHKAYIEFVYDEQYITAFNRVSTKLNVDIKKLERLHLELQAFRLKLFS